jgi:hypothetical protein
MFGHTREVLVASGTKPSVELMHIAASFGKTLHWISFNRFAAETLQQIRVFHVLNGHQVRSWASRYIGF